MSYRQNREGRDSEFKGSTKNQPNPEESRMLLNLSLPEV